ncbi:unnamed protein product [Durusdinium trenchii]|uniref:PDZ domain-containing protein n=1 Tax=Durusdinium trenchii TaxID=1381693 RepID=A0ABP0JNC0_9DINO
MFCYCCESIPEVTVEVHSSPVLNEDGLAVSEPPSQGAFTVSLELEDLKPRLLGVALDSTEEKNLMIVGIFDGIIKKFNEKFPRQGVKQFDKITAVNGKRGSANEMRRMMVSAIADETLDLLQLTIRRPTEIQVQLERPGTLGLQVNYTDLLGGVLISKIVPDGLVDRWNADPKNPLVSVGDRIIALNGEDLKGDDLLESSVTDSSAVSWNSQVTEEEARRKEKKERKSRKQRHHSADAHADRPAKKDDGALPKPHNWAEEVVKASLDPQNQWEFPGPSGKAGYVGQLAAWEQPRARGSEVASRARERAEEVQRWERHHDSQQYIFGTPR